MRAWLLAFLFTQVVECPIYLWAQRGSERRRLARGLVAFGATTLTHPIVWFVIPPFIYRAFPGLTVQPLWGTSAAWLLMLVVAESFAVIAEALYLRELEVPHPWRWSIAANMSSVVLGLLSRHFFGVP